MACCHVSNTCDSCWIGEKNRLRYSTNAMTTAGVVRPLVTSDAPDGEHRDATEVGQQADAGEVDRQQALRLQPRASRYVPLEVRNVPVF